MPIPDAQLVPERALKSSITTDPLPPLLGAPLSATGGSSSYFAPPRSSFSPTPAMTIDTTTESEGSDLPLRTTLSKGGTGERNDTSMHEEVLIEEASLGGSSNPGILRKSSRSHELRGVGVVSRKSSRDQNRRIDDQDAINSQDDEARYPRHTENDKRMYGRMGRESESESTGRDDTYPSHSKTTTTTTTTTGDHSHDERESIAKTSTLLLTLKPRKSSRNVRREPEDHHHESIETDDGRVINRSEQHSYQRKQNDSSHSRTEQKTSARSSPSSRRTRERKPPPTKGSPEFKQFVLPHARVARAPTSGMYISQYPYQGHPPPKALRAHTGTLVGNYVYFIGGCDKYGCWPGVAVFNTETHMWRTLKTGGETTLPPLRAHTTTLVGKTLYVFGGGDGPTYSNEVYAFDTITHTWSKPRISTPPSDRPLPRRAHTAVHYTHHLLIFGGGNGQAALNDVWACDVQNPSELRWKEWRATGDVPVCKGYHTANLIGEKMVVYGGSDGVHSFANVHVLDIPSMVWREISTEVRVRRLSHTSTQVGSYLFIIGGHDGQKYSQEVLLFNLVTLSWESKPLYGTPPAGRGYHVTVLHDSRLLISGGYDGHVHFGDLYALELASCAYLPQVTTFEVNEKAKPSMLHDKLEAVSLNQGDASDVPQ